MAEYVRGCLDTIAKHGWMVQGVFGDAPNQTFAYTVGLAGQNKPELIMTGVAPSTAAGLLNDTAQREFQAGDLVAGVVDGYPLYALQVLDSSTHLTLVNRIYANPDGSPVAALQLVWPDDQARFPWNTGYELSPEYQELLGTPYRCASGWNR